MAKDDNPFLAWAKPTYNFAASDDVPPDFGRTSKGSAFPMEGNLKNAPKAVQSGGSVSDSELSRTEQRFSSQQQGSSEFTGSARTISGDIYTNPWEAERDQTEHRWTDTFIGRASTRLVSRGVLGTIGMTTGTLILGSYNPHMPYGQMSKTHRALNAVADGLDTVFGYPFRFFGKKMGYEAEAIEDFLTFRPNANFMLREEGKAQHDALRPLYNLNKEVRAAIEHASKTPETGAERMWVIDAPLKAAYPHFDELKKSKIFGQKTLLEISPHELTKELKARQEMLHDANHLSIETDDLSTKPYAELFNEKSLKRIWDQSLSMKSINGRTYGQEMVGVTLDFAAGSFFDAMGRNLMAGLDPNRRKEWKDEDGNINYGKLAKAIGNSFGQAFFYNQMEDWFSAPFYAWEMRALRNGLNKGWPGFKIASDIRAANSFLVDSNMNITGTFGMPGSIDLGARFMLYNNNTLLFRDLYNHGYQKFKKWREDGYSMTFQLPQHPIEAVGHGISETAKYLGKTFIKSQIYMFPAVLTFFPQRVAQQMYEGRFLNIRQGTDESPSGVVSDSPAVRPAELSDEEKYYRYAEYPVYNTPELGKHIKVDLKDGELRTVLITPADEKNLINVNGKQVFRLTPTFSGEDRIMRAGRVAEKMAAHPETQAYFEYYKTGLGANGEAISRIPQGKIPGWLNSQFDPYTYEFEGRTLVDRGLGKLGQWQQYSANGLDKLGGKVFKGYGNWKLFGADSKTIARNLSNNFWSYYPYMVTKDEMARRMDNEVMDASIYRFEDGISKLNWKDFSEGASDIWHSIWHQPVSDKTYSQSFVARGLTNSRQDLSKREAEEQKALRDKTKNTSLAAGSEAPGTPSTVIKTKEQEKEGWAPYQVAHASMNDKSVPPGATIH